MKLVIETPTAYANKAFDDVTVVPRLGEFVTVWPRMVDARQGPPVDLKVVRVTYDYEGDEPTAYVTVENEY